MRILPFFIILSVLISSIEGSGKIRSTKNNRTMKQKLTKFTVYWQDIVSGTHPTAVTIIPPASNSSSSGTFFGMTRMIDNALTTEPDLKSSVVGRAQGFYASASQSPPMCFMMAMNFAFTSGKYNGSSLTLMGSNPAMSEVRELPVLGGSGLFRFARGYARLSTRWLDLETGDATVQYNVTVLHYG